MTRRPFALLGFSAFAALALAAWLGPEPSSILCRLCMGLGTCALFCMLILRIRRKLPGRLRPEASSVFRGLLPVSVALLTAGTSFFLYGNAWARQAEPVESLVGVEARIRGRVLDYPSQTYHKCFYLVEVDRVSVGGTARELDPFTVRLSTWQPFSSRPWDTVECSVEFYAFDQSGGLYSTRNNQLADGAALGAYLSGGGESFVLPTVESPPQKLFAELRHRIGRSFEKLLPGEEAGLIRAMLLGERGGVSDTAYQDFKQIGASHLLVISGLHMAALAGFLALLFGRLPLGRVGRNLLTAGTLFCFLALTAFPVSAVRSGVMFFLYLLASCFGREPDGVNSLGFAVLLICLLNPFSGGDLGFALSVAATLGILVLADRLTQSLLRPFRHRARLCGVLSPVAASLGVTLSALLFTLPIQLLVFGGIPLLAPLANLVLILPCTLLLYASFAAAFLGLLPGLAGMAAPFALCAGWLGRFVQWAAHGLAGIQGGFFDLGQSTWLIVLGAALLVLLVVFLPGKKDRLVSRAAALGIAVLIAAGGLYEIRRWRGVVTVAVAGTDSSCVVLMKEGKAAILSLGGFQTGAAASLLSRNNIREVETLCLPVRDLNARQAAVRVLRTYGADRLVLPGTAYLGKDLLMAGQRAERCYLRDGDSFQVLDGVTVTVSRQFSRLSFTANGTPVIVETGESGPGGCGLLVTNQQKSRVNSSFTVLQTDVIMTENGSFAVTEQPVSDTIIKNAAPESASGLEELPPGRCVLPGGEGLSLDLFRDGTVGVRGESQCLQSERAN